MMRPTSSTLPMRSGLAGLAALLLAGCAAIPRDDPQVAMRLPESVAAEQSLGAQTTGAWPADEWWRGFGDAQLDALVAEALRDAPDVQAAQARYRRALALAQVEGAALLPSLDATGTATLDKQSRNTAFPKEFIPRGWQDNGQVAARLEYELDIWGRNRAALAAARSEADAAALDAYQARLTLATGIASAYADLARLFEVRDVRESSLGVREATRRLVADRVTQGLEHRGNLRQAEAQVETARSDLVAADREIALRRHQIAVLVGAGPDRGLAIERPRIHRATASGLPAGVTTDLVARRPDVLAARERVEAQAGRIDVARADFFPSIRLDALIGLQSFGLGNLLESDSTFGSVGPAISLPIFHGGSLRGRYRAAQAQYDEAVATYNGAVLDAYRQVADAVSGRDRTVRQLGHANAALAAAREAFEIAQLRYRGGLSPYLDVLTVEDRLLEARLAQAGLEASALAFEIDLVRALGGGFGNRAPGTGGDPRNEEDVDG